MKKILLSLAAVVMACIGAKAETAVFYATESVPSVNADYSYQLTGNVAGNSYEAGDITLAFTKNNSSTSNVNSNLVRFYANDLMTISPTAENSAVIKSITVACASGYAKLGLDSPTEGLTTSGTTVTFKSTEGVSKVVLKATAQSRFSYVLVEYELTAAKAIEDVEISYTVQADNTALVTMSCPTVGAEIYYGFDGESFTETYAAPFTLSETCTVYARAEKGEDKSNVKSLKIALPFTSFKEAIANGVTGEEITIAGNFAVLTQAPNYLLLTDGTSNILVYGSQPTYAAETAIAKIEGKVSFYNNLFEITDAILTEGGEGASIEPTELASIADINYDDNLFDLVILKSAKISGKNGSSATITFGTETVTLYNNLGLTFSNDENLDITGFVWRNKTTLQICPMLIVDGEPIPNVETPEIRPNKTELKMDEFVTITCATPNATIYYTVDGSDPTQESEKYTEPIAFTNNVTIKARAFYENDDIEMHPSDIAERTYSVYNPYCNIITTDHHDGDVMNYSSYAEHSCVIDDVEYTMFGAHDKTRGLQMNNSSGKFCYVIQSSDNEGLAIDGIEIDFNLSETVANNEPKFIVRASNKPFEANKERITSDGVYIGEINWENPSVSFTKDYNYFALYLDVTKAIYMNSITINYRDPEPVDMTEVPTFADDFTIVSDEKGFITDKLPYHENWNLKYQVNEGDVKTLEYDDDNDGISHEEELAAASLHTLKMWFEHYYHGTASEPVEFKHVTDPVFTTSLQESEEDGESLTVLDFSTIGEGVKVYFTLNGEEPVIPNENELPAMARGTRAAAADGIYTIDSADDMSATHAIEAGTNSVVIRPIATNETGTTFVLKTKAVHTATGTASSVNSKEITISIPTGVNEIEAAEADALYFNLQGVRVVNPENGTYIRVTNGKANKVIVK